MKYLMLLLLTQLFPSLVIAKEVVEVQTVNTNIALQNSIDYHILSKDNAIVDGITINIDNEDAWLIFDNIKPNDALKQYSKSILIGGKPLDMEDNANVFVYGTGSAFVSHGVNYQPLTTYTSENFTGEVAKYSLSYYYTNQQPDSAPDYLVRRLQNDNAIKSFRLKRGYMATMATNPDGMGYSKVYIADDKDLEVSSLPLELDGKISYIRVFRWQYPTKKGWAGSKWSSMPEGLKYAPEQADLTNSTWYYNWGSSPTINPLNPNKNYNQEYVPEKWGAGGLWNGIYSITDACHLIGYNEPDHSEQSNVTVEKAIEEWPLLMQTGMRLGSPATTDFNWLYNFMNECHQRNYRVDYVVVHAYWGGMSASEWYQKLKVIHQRTKRPLWIKEWNNGANWTKESWPSSQNEQYAKQLRDITSIVSMLDTCSFVERYSIYNWVQDKRMIIDSKGKLTPAGEFYANKKSPYFFNRDKEVAVKWNISEAPLLKYESISNDGKLKLSWSDANGEQIEKYIVREDGIDIETVTGFQHTLELLPMDNTKYTVLSVPGDKTKKGLESNAVAVAVSSNDASNWFHADEAILREQWTPIVFKQKLDNSPLVYAGIPTYRNKVPLATLVRQTTPCSVDLRLRTWEYQKNPSFYNPDTLAFLIAPACNYKDENMQIETASLDNINEEWKKVDFSTTFVDTPVVVLSPQACSDDTAFQLCVRNVNRNGFEVRVRYEGRLHNQSTAHTISYIAATPGATDICGKRIVVGATPDDAVGSNITGAYEVVIGETFSALPMILAQMQTENDTITSTLRLQERQCDRFRIFKDREKSVAHELVKAEKVGWIAIGTSSVSNINTSYVNRKKKRYTINGIPVKENTNNHKYIGEKKGKSLNIKLFNY